MTFRVNDFMSGLFLGIGIRLVDFKIEFGRIWEDDQMRIVLADEISPDSCRLWDAKTNDGQKISSGVYFYMFKSNDSIAKGKVTYLK